MLMTPKKGDSNKMKGSTSIPNMRPCIIVTTNPTKVGKVFKDGGEHTIKLYGKREV